MDEGSERYEVTTRGGLIAFYDCAFDRAFASAARLTRGDAQAAQDLVQEAFVRLVRAARSGDVTRVNVGWVVTTIRRLHLDRLRSRDREQRRLRLAATPSAEPMRGAPTDVLDLLDGLSEREQTALVLRYVEDLPVREVAELMGASVRATESLLQRAKRRVRAAGGAA